MEGVGIEGIYLLLKVSDFFRCREGGREEPDTTGEGVTGTRTGTLAEATLRLSPNLSGSHNPKQVSHVTLVTPVVQSLGLRQTTCPVFPFDSPGSDGRRSVVCLFTRVDSSTVVVGWKVDWCLVL